MANSQYDDRFDPVDQVTFAHTVFINQIFVSVQGEGLFTGEPTTFIRFQYCPYDCGWCDSKRTWKLGETSQRLRVRDVVSQIKTRHVCITGGEPLAQPRAFRNMVASIKYQNETGVVTRKKYSLDKAVISVETSGLHILPSSHSPTFAKVDSWVVDVKLKGATNNKVGKIFFPIYQDLARLRVIDQVKFVVKDECDLDETLEVLRMYPTKAVKLISPMNPTTEKGGVEKAKIDLAWHRHVVEFCIKHGFRYSPQVHKFVGVT